MTRPLSDDLRRRVVRAVVDGGMSRRGAARRFGIAPSTAIKWVSAWRRTGSYRPRAQGGDRRSQRIEARAQVVLALVEEAPDMTLAEIATHLEDEHGLRVSQSTVWRFFHRRGITFKKTAHASEQQRPDVLRRRQAWGEAQPGLDPEKLVFVDETGATTKMARRSGRALRGHRCRAPVPHGQEDHDLRRRTQAERNDRSHGARRRHARRRLPRLRRQGAGAHPRTRRHRGDGQPPRTPQCGRPRSYPKGRRRAPFPTALQPRLQPHRDGILQAQGLPQTPRSPHHPRTLGGHRTSHRQLHPGRMPKLLHCCRI